MPGLLDKSDLVAEGVAGLLAREANDELLLVRLALHAAGNEIVEPLEGQQVDGGQGRHGLIPGAVRGMRDELQQKRPQLRVDAEWNRKRG